MDFVSTAEKSHCLCHKNPPSDQLKTLKFDPPNFFHFRLLTVTLKLTALFQHSTENLMRNLDQIAKTILWPFIHLRSLVFFAVNISTRQKPVSKQFYSLSSCEKLSTHEDILKSDKTASVNLANHFKPCRFCRIKVEHVTTVGRFDSFIFEMQCHANINSFNVEGE